MSPDPFDLPDDNDGRQPILDALMSEAWAAALGQLERVGRARCAFASNELQAIANDPSKSDQIRDRARGLMK